jgi:hypothetical protein
MNPLAKQDCITDISQNHLSGLTTHSGNRFYDNSTLDTMRVCPRRFYYRHIRHWETDNVKPALIFGSAWHSAMDFLWANPTASSAEVFKEGFMAFWNESELKDAESFDLFPRSPGRAAEMLMEYVKRYSSWLQNNIKVEAIEKPFIVPLSDDIQNLFYIGKWDKLFREGRFLYITDHKTSSSFASTWLNGWSPNGQVDGYLYAGHMEYGDEFKSVIIDGALVQKTNIDFIKVPIERQIDMLDSWKWDVMEMIDFIWYHESLLLELRKNNVENNSYLAAYPKCTTSCTSYYGSCPYINLCKFVPNPERIETVPDGFVISNWKPFEIGETPEGTFEVKITMHE